MSKFDGFNKVSTASSDVDAGLKSYMLRVYNYMGFGLLLTAFCSFAVSLSPSLMNAIYGSGLQYVVMFAPLAFVLVLSFGVNKLSASSAQLLFWAFSAVQGISLSYLFIVYTGASLARVFLITSATFLTMSLYGYTTKSDLSRMGSVLMMGLIGIIIASLVNIFMKSSMLDLIVSLFGVIIFTGLTAWDTQKIKLSYDESYGAEMIKKQAIYGALALYLDFINLFLMLLRFIGDRRQ